MVGRSDDYFSLGQVLNKYPNVFLDTNIFLGIKIELDISKKEDFILSYKVREKLAEFWIPVLKENPRIFLTKNIFDELKRDHYNYKRAFKTNPSCGKEYTEIIRVRKRLKNNRNSFLDEFPLERIIDRSTLEEKTLYDGLHEKYNPFTKSSRGIGEKDFDLLLISGIFSKLIGNTCLISNDFGILRCYKSFLIKEGLPRGHFGFYLQKGLNFFKRE